MNRRLLFLRQGSIALGLKEAPKRYGKLYDRVCYPIQFQPFPDPYSSNPEIVEAVVKQLEQPLLLHKTHLKKRYTKHIQVKSP